MRDYFSPDRRDRTSAFRFNICPPPPKETGSLPSHLSAFARSISSCLYLTSSGVSDFASAMFASACALATARIAEAPPSALARATIAAACAVACALAPSATA